MNKLQFIEEAKKLLNRAKEEILLFKEDFNTAVDELLEINQEEITEKETEEQINKGL